jgi:beta-glucosidase
MNMFKLDENLMLGTATASTQIEGGDTNNTWYKWCKEGHISDSSSCITACDHWNRVEQDVDILKSLHVQTHRMSLEWSLIEPKAGEYSKKAIEHYRNEIQLLLDNNIKPLVTLHHFSEPQWFQNMGGWKESKNSELFVEYVRFIIENLGDLVCEWITFNEPNVYTIFGYLTGSYPPGTKNLFEYFRVESEIIKTHIRIYDLIHKIRNQKKFKGKTMVGVAIHIRIFDGISLIGKITASVVNYFFNEIFMEGMTKGQLLFPLSKNGYKYKKGSYVDFIGINYYTRNIVEFVLNPLNYFHKCMNDKDLDKTDLGWDIYPEGIYIVSKKYYNKYKLPIYITENGISDKYDNRRANFIIDHLSYITKATNEGVKIERYYHWTLMNNFEWLYGETGNFGLYNCNFHTQERKAKTSANLYTELCNKKELTMEMIDEFIKDEKLVHS